jgi:xanthine dehydrogenase accessory factor
LSLRDVVPSIDRWLQQGENVAVATVVETWGSAPRAAGAKMAVSESGSIAGSVSGGCVESAVVEAADQVLRTGTPRLLHFGVADETAWAVGLACGGSIDVFVAPLERTIYDAQREALAAGTPFAMATMISGPDEPFGRQLFIGAHGTIGGFPGAVGVLAEEALAAVFAAGRSRRQALPTAELFLEVVPPPPVLIIVGGVHIAVALTPLAKGLGYRTVVVDPRPALGTEARFPTADQIVSDWPDDALVRLGLTQATAVAVLTHDPKLDDPALRVALPSPAFYVGALGSRKTQERRLKRLAEAGVSGEHLARLHAPIGLDLGGRSPEEIALSVMAQIVAARNGRA